jgi:hypothetical protein
MVDKTTTHDADQLTRTVEWKPSMPNEIPTTHQQTAERFTEMFHADPTVTSIAETLTQTAESKRQAVKDALAGDKH